MAVKVPPRPVRALVITPIVFVGALIVAILSPLLHLLLALIDMIDRRGWRFTRVVGLGIAFCVVEVIGLIFAFALWVASGFGIWMRAEWSQNLHRAVVGFWLFLITEAIQTFIGFDFEFPEDALPAGPLLVFSRHAGPGDALLVARSLMHTHNRKVRMLGTTKLLWDPFFNHVVRRLPFHFCEQNPADPEAELREVMASSAGIEDDGAMIIFPEGGNFTPARYRSALQRLEERGQADRAELARHMTHVLPPRTAGAIAALDACAQASAVFVAHVGLDDLMSLDDLWHRVPIRRTVRATFWVAERNQSGEGPRGTSDWLWQQWVAVDGWIDANWEELSGSER